jgi:hypothetical protein
MRIGKLPPELKDLESALRRLDFQNNFGSFEVTVTIPATTELRIPNQMAPVVPSRRIVVRQSGGGAITDGTSTWDREAVYLYNTGASSTTIKVIFIE